MLPSAARCSAEIESLHVASTSTFPLAAPSWLFFTSPFTLPHLRKPVPATWMEIFLQMDLPGLVTLTSSIICFVLALQWGGVTKVWSSADVVGTLVGWIALLLLFTIIQRIQGERALIVGRTLKIRNTMACCIFIFLQVSRLWDRNRGY